MLLPEPCEDLYCWHWMFKAWIWCFQSEELTTNAGTVYNAKIKWRLHEFHGFWPYSNLPPFWRLRDIDVTVFRWLSLDEAMMLSLTQSRWLVLPSSSDAFYWRITYASPRSEWTQCAVWECVSVEVTIRWVKRMEQQLLKRTGKRHVTGGHNGSSL